MQSAVALDGAFVSRFRRRVVAVVALLATFAVATVDASEASYAATAPGAPTALAAAPVNAALNLSWTAPSSNGGAAITDYRVQYKLTSSSTWSTFNDAVSAATTASVTGLVNGTGYDVRVAAINSVGAGVYSGTASGTPRTVPSAPGGLSTSAGAGSVAMSWSAPANGGAAITDYQVQFKTSAGSTWTTLNDGVSTSTTATVTGLTNGTAYDVRVAGVNAAGAGAWATGGNIVPRTTPGAPGPLAASAGAGQLALTWSAPANGGSAVTDYRSSSRRPPAARGPRSTRASRPPRRGP